MLMLFSVLGLTVFLSFRKVLQGFFQQDEWLSFSFRLLNSRENILNLLKEAFIPSVGHYQPLNTLVIQILFNLFGLNYTPYALISIFLHIVNVFTVFYLSKILFSNLKISFLVALLFGITASSYQATSWVLADIGIHLATFFALLSLVFTFKFLNERKLSKFVLSVIFLIISLLFKEIALGLFILIPIIYLLFSPKRIKKKRKYLGIIIFIGALYLSLRLIIFFLPQAYLNDEMVTKSQPLGLLIYNITTFPVKGVVQSIIPPELLVKTAYFLSDNFLITIAPPKGTPEYDNFVQKKVLESVSLIFFIIIFILSLVVWQKNNKSLWGRYIIFSFVFMLINSPIFALAPERSGRIFIMDSRNLYFINVGASILLVVSLYRIIASRLLIFLMIIFFIIGANIYLLDQKLTKVAEAGGERKSILEQIKNEHSYLSKKAIFYTESDSALYGLPDVTRILPFQSGLGQTLIIWYYPSRRFPREFLQNKFLWEITSQGYKEVGDRGFGYFRDFNLLTETVKAQGVPLEGIIAYTYDSNTGKINDISGEIKDRIEGYLVERQSINPQTITVDSSYNPKDIDLIIDGNKSTFWDSKNPYAKPQLIDIDLGQIGKVAQISIYSGDNKDQGKVGYEVLLSPDKKSWEKVFSSKVYPPQENGLDELFFKPTAARYIKINQIGYHPYASWVINELSIFESID